MEIQLDWAADYSLDTLKMLCNTLINQNASLIQDRIFLEGKIRAIVDAARRAWPLLSKESTTGLTQLVEVIRQGNDRCKKRAEETQAQRSREAQKEIDSFRAAKGSRGIDVYALTDTTSS